MEELVSELLYDTSCCKLAASCVSIVIRLLTQQVKTRVQSFVLSPHMLPASAFLPEKTLCGQGPSLTSTKEVKQ